MAKLRSGTAELRVQTGRWIGLKREDRIYDQCGLREVENVDLFDLQQSNTFTHHFGWFLAAFSSTFDTIACTKAKTAIYIVETMENMPCLFAVT